MMILRDMEFVNGLMEKDMMDHGLIIKCTERANFIGLMENYTRVILQKINFMVMGNSLGPAEFIIKVNGKMEK